MVYRGVDGHIPGPSTLEKGSWYGENPVLDWNLYASARNLKESSILVLIIKPGSKFLLKINISWRLIAQNYHEGKMQKTLKIELNSIWNVCKGSEGNQYHRSVMFPAPLGVWALWLATGYHGFVLGEILVREVASLGVLYSICTVLGWSGESRYAPVMLIKCFHLPWLETWTK